MTMTPTTAEQMPDWNKVEDALSFIARTDHNGFGAECTKQVGLLRTWLAQGGARGGVKFTPHDWQEDFIDTDNGRYECKCVHCGSEFYGHKRRVSCKLCTVAAALNAGALAGGEVKPIVTQVTDKMITYAMGERIDRLEKGSTEVQAMRAALHLAIWEYERLRSLVVGGVGL